MAKLIITDGFGLIKPSPVQRYLLGRRCVAFELERMITVSVQNTPKRSDLGEKPKHGWLPFSRTGEYQNGAKKEPIYRPKEGSLRQSLDAEPCFG